MPIRKFISDVLILQSLLSECYSYMEIYAHEENFKDKSYFNCVHIKRIHKHPFVANKLLNVGTNPSKYLHSNIFTQKCAKVKLVMCYKAKPTRHLFM